MGSRVPTQHHSPGDCGVILAGRLAGGMGWLKVMPLGAVADGFNRPHVHRGRRSLRWRWKDLLDALPGFGRSYALAQHERLHVAGLGAQGGQSAQQLREFRQGEGNRASTERGLGPAIRLRHLLKLQAGRLGQGLSGQESTEQSSFHSGNVSRFSRRIPPGENLVLAILAEHGGRR